MKKKVSIVIVALLLMLQPNWSIAQTTKLSAMKYIMGLDELAGEEKLFSFESRNAEVTIVGSDKDEISIIAVKGWVEKKDIGYKSVDIKDIEKIDLTFRKERKGVQFRQLSEDFMMYWIEIPKDMSIRYRDGSVFPNHVTVAHLKSEVSVKTMLSTIRIQDIDGRILANSQAGNIEIEYGKKIHPSSMASAGRTVTVKMLKDTKAKLSLKVMTGVVTSEFELEGGVSQKDLDGTHSVRKIESSINGGGEGIYIVAHSIFIKKAKCEGKLGNIKQLFKKKKKKDKAVELYTYPCE